MPRISVLFENKNPDFFEAHYVGHGLSCDQPVVFFPSPLKTTEATQILRVLFPAMYVTFAHISLRLGLP